MTPRMAVIKAQRPKQHPSFKGLNIYFNDYLKKYNADLAQEARQLVKSSIAQSTWVRDG